MREQLIGYLICAAIIAFGLLYHLSGWARARGRKAPPEERR